MSLQIYICKSFAVSTFAIIEKMASAHNSLRVCAQWDIHYSHQLFIYQINICIARSSPFVLPKKVDPKNRIVQFFSEESNCFSQFFHTFCFSQHCVFQAQSTDAEHFCVKSVFWQYFSSLHILLQCYCILTWSYRIELFQLKKKREPI